MLLEALLSRIAKHLRCRVIKDRHYEDAYLERYYLLGGPRGEAGDRPVNLFLHHFCTSDDARALHNHPWKWSVSLILTGGYIEERRISWGDAIDGEEQFGTVRRIMRPGRLNFLRNSTFHRLDLLRADCWTLFLAGPRVNDWGFWRPTSPREFIPHFEFKP